MQLEATLRSRFPHDVFAPMPKDACGGHVLQTVTGPANHLCGTILWASKQTKRWSDGWLAKLREDQRQARADVAVIVSSALPKGVPTLGHIDGVWVAEGRCAVPIAVALRRSLIGAACEAAERSQTRMKLVWSAV